MKISLALVVLTLIATAPLSAAVRPDDQRLAKRLTLRLDDFPSGWTVAQKSSRRFRRSTCSNAPKMQRYITGFSDSHFFRPVDEGDPQRVTSTTRVFPSEDAARRWFNWAGGGKQTLCLRIGHVADEERDGYAVTRVRHTRQSFKGSCYPCPTHELRAWSIRYRAAKDGQSWDIFRDHVAVRVGRTVIGFYFYDEDFRFIGGEALVGEVLARA